MTTIIPVKFRHIGANKRKVSIGIDVESELLSPNEFADLFRGKRITGELQKPEDKEELPGVREPAHSVHGVFDSPGASLPADKLSATLSLPASEEVLVNLFRLTGGKGSLVIHDVSALVVEEGPKRPRGRPRKNQPASNGAAAEAQKPAAAAAETQPPTPVVPLAGQRQLPAGDETEGTEALEPLDGDPAKLATPITSVQGIPEKLKMALVDAGLESIERVMRWIRSGRDLVGIGKAGRTKIADAIAAFMHGVPADDGLTGLCYGCAKCSTRFPKGVTNCPKCNSGEAYEVGHHGEPSAIEDGSIVLGVESLTVDKGSDGMTFSVLVGRDKAGRFRGGYIVMDGDTSIEEFYPNVLEPAAATRSDALGIGAAKMIAKVEAWQGDAQFVGQLRDRIKALGVKVGPAPASF